MRRSDVTTVRRSVVGTHVRTVIRSVFVEAVAMRLIAVRLHVGTVIRSVLVKAIALGGLPFGFMSGR